MVDMVDAPVSGTDAGTAFAAQAFSVSMGRGGHAPGFGGDAENAGDMNPANVAIRKTGVR
ncbi:MAG TPA: hypothetical protein VFB20_09540 [Burkholderiales bacterium]|nr:hypothetical protein [Burkholderiales bacterium]